MMTAALCCSTCENEWEWEGRPYGVVRCPECGTAALVRRVLSGEGKARIRLRDSCS